MRCPKCQQPIGGGGEVASYGTLSAPAARDLNRQRVRDDASAKTPPAWRLGFGCPYAGLAAAETAAVTPLHAPDRAPLVLVRQGPKSVQDAVRAEEGRREGLVQSDLVCLCSSRATIYHCLKSGEAYDVEKTCAACNWCLQSSRPPRTWGPISTANSRSWTPTSATRTQNPPLCNP